MKKAKILIGIISVIAGVAALLLVAVMCFGWKYHQANRLITAINNEDVATVEELLENGVDPNQTDVPPSFCWSFFEFSARRPLAEACSTGNLEIVSLLVEHGATAEYIEHTGWSPLRETLFYYQPDDVQIVEMLLQNGADADVVEDEGVAFVAARMTPKVFDKEKTNGTVFAGGYDESTGKGITQIVQMLLGDGDINATNTHGETLLMISAKKENICLARWLIEAGADPAKVDNKGNTAMDYAELSGNEQLITVLETATADAAA